MHQAERKVELFWWLHEYIFFDSIFCGFVFASCSRPGTEIRWGDQQVEKNIKMIIIILITVLRTGKNDHVTSRKRIYIILCARFWPQINQNRQHEDQATRLMCVYPKCCQIMKNIRMEDEPFIDSPPPASDFFCASIAKMWCALVVHQPDSR